jgi:nucleotide-binding universal stress UspA family protein
LERLTEGSLAGPLAARASCPIVVVPPYHRQRGPHAEDEVVVALDATSAAEAALQFGFEEAALRQARLVALHASPPDLTGADALRESEAERRTLAEMLAGWKADFPEVSVQTVVLSGEPQDLIVQASRNAGLMIVGRPHGSLIGRWSRSVAHTVLKRTRCPIAVVPPSTALRSRVSRLMATQRGQQ